ncbi:unnamed protein product [Lymnaea stagnalis]|uniref:Chromo domain-containing protein n=1 Tax=Lymnaea stagnalis TaxID=6523 RepID=A0AAV2HH34_LYMST
MASFSDDEKFEVDAVLEQRKRKGVLEYLVRWKGAGDSADSESWEPAKSIAGDCAQAVKQFVASRKKQRSTSRSRKVSRSRSRSSSRNRKAAASKEKSKSPSRSRGRPSKAKEDTSLKKEEISKVAAEGSTLATPDKVTQSKKAIVITESNSTINFNAAIVSTEGNSSKVESKDETDSSSKMASSSSATSNLEVQRVHNEQRPVCVNDNKPRSAIWKVADYAVIVLFIISLIAAVFLFLEKIFDLEDFKTQALPNMEILRTRLSAGIKSLTDVAFQGVDTISDAWLYLVEQIQGGNKVKANVGKSASA